MEQKKDKKVLLYDGTCSLCSVVVDKLEQSPHGAIEAVDASSAELPAGISRESAMHEVHLVSGDKVYRGIDAVLEIMKENPRTRLLAQISSLPVIKQILTLGYRFVAANRHRIFPRIPRGV